MLLLEPTAVLVCGALRGAAMVEAVALRSRGAEVQIVTPDDSAGPLNGAAHGPPTARGASWRRAVSRGSRSVVEGRRRLPAVLTYIRAQEG